MSKVSFNREIMDYPPGTKFTLVSSRKEQGRGFIVKLKDRFGKTETLMYDKEREFDDEVKTEGVKPMKAKIIINYAHMTKLMWKDIVDQAKKYKLKVDTSKIGRTNTSNYSFVDDNVDLQFSGNKENLIKYVNAKHAKKSKALLKQLSENTTSLQTLLEQGIMEKAAINDRVRIKKKY
jgi:hypothetical protein